MGGQLFEPTYRCANVVSSDRPALPVNLDIELLAGSALRGDSPRNHQRQVPCERVVIDGVAVPEPGKGLHCVPDPGPIRRRGDYAPAVCR